MHTMRTTLIVLAVVALALTLAASTPVEAQGRSGIASGEGASLLSVSWIERLRSLMARLWSSPDDGSVPTALFEREGSSMDPDGTPAEGTGAGPAATQDGSAPTVLVGQAGSQMDPDGTPGESTDVGLTMEPDGSWGLDDEAGSSMDPDG